MMIGLFRGDENRDMGCKGNDRPADCFAELARHEGQAERQLERPPAPERLGAAVAVGRAVASAGGVGQLQKPDAAERAS